MKKKRIGSSIFIISATMVFGVLMLLLGTVVLGETVYPYDIYISKNVTLSIAQEVENQYLIQGEITNKGTETIIIEKIELRCYNADSSKHGAFELENIVIEAGKTYKIYEEIQSNGEIQYTYARIHKTVVEGEEIILKYSADGKSFGNKQNEITAIIVGAVLILISVSMIVVRIIRKRRAV